MTFDDIIVKINKEDFTRCFCDELLPLSELCKLFDVCPSTLNKIINYFQLSRDSKQVKSKSNKIAKNTYFEEIKNSIDRDTLYNYYIVDDHDYKQSLTHFNITGWTFDRLLKEYCINKNKKNSSKKGIYTKYKNAGGKENYDAYIKGKQEETILKKYVSMSDYYTERRKKAEATNLERYGHIYKQTSDLIENHSELYQKVWHSKKDSIEFLKSYEQRPSLEDLAIALNCSINCLHLWIEKYDLGSYISYKKSKYEDEVMDFVENLGFVIDRNNRTLLNGKEIDIYIPEKRLAIEFNGNYWHSVQQVGKNYHYQKSIECEKLGVRLIHIYQYQWLDPIKKEILKSIIRNALGQNQNIIYARKCNIKVLSKIRVEEFSNLNSLHGHRNASIYLGLYHNNELVEIMSFGKAFFSRDPSIAYECIRSITKLNTTVIGGMNKLFKYFITNYSPTKILYYVDYNTHIGNSMQKLGFKFISYSKHSTVNIANCKEVRDKYGYVFNRKPNKNKEIQKYINEGKILPVYDAGVKKYIWEDIDR